jgi:hypothetical protein
MENEIVEIISSDSEIEILSSDEDLIVIGEKINEKESRCVRSTRHIKSTLSDLESDSSEDESEKCTKFTYLTDLSTQAGIGSIKNVVQKYQRKKNPAKILLRSQRIGKNFIERLMPVHHKVVFFRRDRFDFSPQTNRMRYHKTVFAFNCELKKLRPNFF